MTEDEPPSGRFLSLPDSLRPTLREPMGPVYGDIAGLLAATDGPIVAVGDVVVAELLRADRPPEVAIVDGRTKRQDVAAGAGPEIATTLGELPTGRVVSNPPGTLSRDLLIAVREHITDLSSNGVPTLSTIAVIDVDGEEDLATLPAVAVAPPDTMVAYGQPDRGVVGVSVDPGTRARAIELLDRFEGNQEWRRLLGIDDAA